MACGVIAKMVPNSRACGLTVGQLDDEASIEDFEQQPTCGHSEVRGGRSLLGLACAI